MARKKSEVDYKRVDEMLEAGCNGAEVAAAIGMHPDTLYKRIEDDFAVCFSAYKQEKVSKGDQLLREKLYEKAKKGDSTSLIFLSKTRLGMTEKQEIKHTVDDKAPIVLQITFRPPTDEDGQAPGK